MPRFLPALQCPQAALREPPAGMGPGGFLGLLCSARPAVLRAPRKTRKLLPCAGHQFSGAGGGPFSFALFVCLRVAFSVGPKTPL